MATPAPTGFAPEPVRRRKKKPATYKASWAAPIQLDGGYIPGKPLGEPAEPEGLFSAGAEPAPPPAGKQASTGLKWKNPARGWCNGVPASEVSGCGAAHPPGQGWGAEGAHPYPVPPQQEHYFNGAAPPPNVLPMPNGMGAWADLLREGAPNGHQYPHTAPHPDGPPEPKLHSQSSGGSSSSSKNKRNCKGGFVNGGGDSMWTDALCSFQVCTQRDQRPGAPMGLFYGEWGSDMGGQPGEAAHDVNERATAGGNAGRYMAAGGMFIADSMNNMANSASNVFSRFNSPSAAVTTTTPHGKAVDFLGGSPSRENSPSSPSGPPGGEDEADAMLVDELIKHEGEKGLWTLVTELFNQPTNPAPPVSLAAASQMPNAFSPGSMGMSTGISPPTQRPCVDPASAKPNGGAHPAAGAAAFANGGERYQAHSPMHAHALNGEHRTHGEVGSGSSLLSADLMNLYEDVVHDGTVIPECATHPFAPPPALRSPPSHPPRHRVHRGSPTLPPSPSQGWARLDEKRRRHVRGGGGLSDG